MDAKVIDASPMDRGSEAVREKKSLLEEIRNRQEAASWKEASPLNPVTVPLS